MGRDLRIGGSSNKLYLPPREKRRETYIRRYPSLGEGSFERKYVRLYEVDYLEKNRIGNRERSVSIVPLPCRCQYSQNSSISSNDFRRYFDFSTP